MSKSTEAQQKLHEKKDAARTAAEQRAKSTFAATTTSSLMKTTQASAAPPTAAALPKTEAKKWHGYMCGDCNFPAPIEVYHSDELARKDYTNTTRSEYRDPDDVLDKKADIIIQMFLRANAISIFVGAGIETSCGTPDYASARRVGGVIEEKKLPTKLLSPSPAHRVIAEMFKSGKFKFCEGRFAIQQNHSCMFERAGIPFARVNNMHGVNMYNETKTPGALGREENPVVKMAGSLRDDLFNDILATEQKTDFCFALGTSFSGMNVERVAVSAAERHIKTGAGQGTALVTIQKTPMDEKCALRIFDTCDDFCLRIAEKLRILIDVNTDFEWTTQKPHKPLRGLTKAAVEAEQRMKVLKAKIEAEKKQQQQQQQQVQAAKKL